MAYYKRIRELREDSDLTQRQVAEILKMTQPQYFRYEQGYRDIPTDILISLADFYQTSTDYILGRTNNPAPPEKYIPQKSQRPIWGIFLMADGWVSEAFLRISKAHSA